jgi:hypothetical protein
MTINDSTKVGYGRPPKSTQFKKGQSGNPKGRPKGTLNLTTVLDKELREKVIINENGQRKTVTKMEAAIKQLVNKSAGGDLAALRHLMMLVISAEERSSETEAPDTKLGETDQRVLERILKRFSNGATGRKSNESERT